MATLSDTYNSIADLNFWFKTREGDELVLADLPKLIPLRWVYLRDNWEFIKPGLQARTASYDDPDFLNEQIKDFSRFLESQRISAKKINPLSDGIMLNRYYAVFNNLPINDVNLTNEEQQLVAAKVAQVQAFSKNNFLAIKKVLTDYRDRQADIIDLNDPDYDRTYHKSSIPPQLVATITDLNLLLTVQQAIKSVDFVLANLFAVDAAVDPFAIARANANNPNIDIGSYLSGTLVKMNHGDDLQDLARKHLGDPNKWVDIAIANGLKPPYIDEIGERLSLLSNGNSNQINIAGTDLAGNLNINKFFINQLLFLQSDTQVFPDQRSIISIRQIPVSGEIILELDGEPNLDQYKVQDNANVRVYKPNTINSSFYVLIPSQEPLPNNRKEEVPWFLAKKGEDEKRAKIDIAIDVNGDLNFTTNGDLRLSYGLDNAIQAIKLKMLTEVGSLRYHPNFGLVNLMGSQTNDVETLKSLLIESVNKQITEDARFDRLESVSVEYGTTSEGASALAITVSVRLAGGGTVIPISFTVNH